jgi:hypothetical protein
MSTEMDQSERSLEILYVDKNNTPDSWELNSKILKQIAEEENGKSLI